MEITERKAIKTQIPKNAVMAFLSFLTYSLSAIWLTPYLVKNLGSAAYGLVPLAGLFTQYVTIITAQISNSVNRFLTIEILSPNGDPNRLFNSAFALYLILVLIQLPFFSLGIVYADQIFSIPEGLKVDALLLLGFSAGSFLVSLLGAVFGVSLFAMNRLDIGNGMVISRLILRLLLIVILFSFLGARLRYIGYVDFGLQVVYFGISILYCRKLTPDLFISFRAIDWSVLKPIFRMSIWTLVNRMGALLYLGSDIWIINRFISPVAAGQYAAILVIANFVRQLASQVSGQLAPTIMNCWANDDLDTLKRLLSFSVKILAFGLAIPVALLCINGKQVLGLWLGEEFTQFSLLLLVMLIHLPVNASVLPLFNLLTASNSVRIPALVTLVMGVVNVSASYYLGVAMGKGVMGVALATALVLTLKNSLFTPIYAACVLKLPKAKFLWPQLGGVAMLGLVYMLSFVPITHRFNVKWASHIDLIIQGIFICMVCGLVGWVFIVTRDEKRVLVSMLPGKIRNLLNRSSSSVIDSGNG